MVEEVEKPRKKEDLRLIGKEDPGVVLENELKPRPTDQHHYFDLVSY